MLLQFGGCAPLATQPGLDSGVFALVRRDKTLVKVFLEDEYASNFDTQQVLSLLENAASHGDEPLLQMLLDARGKLADTRFGFGPRVMVIAAAAGNQGVVKALINAGAGVNLQDEYDHSPLYAACLGGHLIIVQVLLEAGAEVNLSAGMNDMTPLQVVTAAGRVEVMRLPLVHGAEVNSRESRSDSAFVCAMLAHRHDAVKVLIEHGANVLLERIDGRCALIWAADLGKLQTVRYLAAETVKADTDKSHLRGVLSKAIAAARSREYFIFRLSSEEREDMVKLLEDHLSALESS